MMIDLLAKGETSNQNIIVSKLRDLINFKNLEPGDKLPSERMLSEKFEVTRGSIREVIQLFEFYGLLKSKPQSGTFIADIGQIAMNGMIDEILRLEEPDFKSLVETRIMFELNTVSLAAERRTKKHLDLIEKALEDYKEKANNGENAVQEDLLFHLAIAQASCNSTMNKLMLTITPNIITNFEKYHVCDYNLSKKGIIEHQEIFDAIKAQDSNMAREKMNNHFAILHQFCNK